MSATRRTLGYAVLAGFLWLAGAVLHAVSARQPVAVLVPDTLGVPHWAVCRPDSTGLRWRIEWWPARQVDR